MRGSPASIYNFGVPVRFIQPCNPIRAKEVPAGDGWVHEVKFDGYRVQAHKIGRHVVLFSRNGHDFTERFPSIAQQLLELPAKAAVIDSNPARARSRSRERVVSTPGNGPPAAALFG